MEHAPGVDLGECARLTETEQPSTHTNSTHLGLCLKLLTTLGTGTARKLRHGIPSHSSWQTVIWAFRLTQSSSRALPCPPPRPSRPPALCHLSSARVHALASPPHPSTTEHPASGIPGVNPGLPAFWPQAAGSPALPRCILDKIFNL